MYIFFVLIFFIFFIVLKFFQKKEQVVIRKMKTSSFYTENFDLLFDFSNRESKVKKASSIFLTRESLKLAMLNDTFSSSSIHDYQKIDYQTYATTLDVFPSISGVLIFDIRNGKLTKTYITRDNFLKLIID